MKKLYTLIALIIAGVTVASAQRTIDLSLEEILEPTNLNSTTQGTVLDFTLVLKNNGTDAIAAGDTILYQMAINNDQGQTLIIAPAQNQFYIKMATKTYNSGDTMHVVRKATTNLYATKSFNITMVAVAYVLNRGANPITNETSPGTNNNRAEKNMVWYNPQGWGVSVQDVNKEDIFTVYPNPATDVLNLDWQIASAGEKEAKVNIYSIDGKLVKSVDLTGFGNAEVSISDLESGMYIVEFQSGSIKSTQKIQVNN